MAAITSPSETILVDVRDNVCWISFNRPDSLNALNSELVSALDYIITAVGDQDDIRCVTIQGAGDHFMAGGDIKKFKVMLDTEPDMTARRHEFERLLHNVHEVIFKMRKLRQPIIAIVKGAVAGAGVSLMMACDLVVASEKSFFTLAYCHLGVSPDGGSTYHLPRMVGMKRAFEIALLGNRFDADKAEKWGLINQSVSADELEKTVSDLADELASLAPETMQLGLAAYEQQDALAFDEALPFLQEQIAQCFQGDDAKEGIAAFLEKRKPNWK